MKTRLFGICNLCVVVSLLFVFIGCNHPFSNNTPTTPTTTATGTAAIGNPLAGAAVTLKDAKGTSATTTTASDGTYSVNTGGMTPPFLVQITFGSGESATTLYSVSADANTQTTINVTPLTDLVVRSFYAAQTPAVSADTAFNTPSSNPAPSSSAVSVISGAVLQMVSSGLSQAGVTTSSFNLISTPFVTNGSGADQVLDNTTITGNPYSGPVQVVTTVAGSNGVSSTSASTLSFTNGSGTVTTTVTSSSGTTTTNTSTVGVTGSGAVTSTPEPAVSLNTSGLTFTSEPVGIASAVQSITLTNTGNASLAISGITSTGDFTESNNCGSSVAANASCTISVSFKPTTTGSRSGTLSIADNMSSQAQTVSLSGTAISAALQSIAVTSASSSIAKGLTDQFTATGSYSDGTTKTITATVNWSSDTTSVATIAAGGLATGVSVGSAKISASFSGISSPAVSLSVTAATLQSIAVTATASSVMKGSTDQFTATGSYSDGTTKTITATVNWSSDTTSVATIAAGGLATGVSAGSTNISASLNNITSPATLLTITVPPLQSIMVSGGSLTVAIGGSLNLTATGTYSDSSTQDITNTVVWTSDSSSATVAAGVVTGVSTGTANITATGAGGVKGTVAVTLPSQTRVYSGSASVGDFLTFTINQSAKTISYTNTSNGTAGTATYTTDFNGNTTLNDPNGNLLSLSEVPGYGIVAMINNASATKDQLALVTSVTQQPISIRGIENSAYNVLEFRTRGGGVGISTFNIDANANLTLSEYMPFNLLSAKQNGVSNTGFNFSTIPLTQVVVQPQPQPTYLEIQSTPPPNGSGTNYVFTSPNGMFLNDSEDGSAIGLPKAATKNFNAAWAGTYSFTYYQKTNAYGPNGNSPEAGDISWGVGKLVLDQSGNVTLTDAQNNTMAHGQLQAIADTPYLYNGKTSQGPYDAGGGALADPCFGLFTFQTANSTTDQLQQVFAAFTSGTVLLSSYTMGVQSFNSNGMPSYNPGNDYNYFYGVGTPNSITSSAANSGNSNNTGDANSGFAPGAWGSTTFTGSYASAQSAQRVYVGSSNNGDLLTFTITPPGNGSAGTLAYYDVTNGNTYTVGYTYNSNGTVTINDTNGYVTAAWETPGQLLLLQMNNTGYSVPTTDAAPDFVIAVPQMTLTGADFTNNGAGQTYNYISMMSGNNTGDVAAGSVSIDGNGNLTGNGYKPWALLQGSPMTSAYNDLDQLEFPLATYPAPWVGATDNEGGFADRGVYLFGYPGSLMFLNTATQGTLVAFPQSSSESSAFQNSSIAGTYNVVFYRRAVTGYDSYGETGPTTGEGSPAAGNWHGLTQTRGAVVGTATLTVGTDGLVSLVDNSNKPNASWQGYLVPVSSAGLYGTGSDGKLTNPCPGLYTILPNSMSASGSGSNTIVQQSQIFIGFVPGGQSGKPLALLSGFTTTTEGTPAASQANFSYRYGIGMQSSAGAPALAAIYLSPASPMATEDSALALVVNGTERLTATGLFSDGSMADETSSVTWSSSNNNIAAVSAGTVTAKNAGVATITATSGSIQGTMVVQVTTQPSSLSVTTSSNAASLMLSIGGTAQLQATATNNINATSVATWTSSNTTAATVNSSGIVTALAAGSSTITATWGTAQGTINVTVLAQGAQDKLNRYSGTASVGDFLTVAVDPVAHTISYNNISNGQTGSAIPYSVNSDGSYAIADPTGNLVAAYEVPGYALLIEANRMGPNMNTMALVTAVESGQVSLKTFAGNYNYMQFRTSTGGVDIGAVNVGTTSAITTSYWPYGETNGNNDAFSGQTMSFASATVDPSGTFINLPSDVQGEGTSYIFGTANGFFIVDTPNGAILGLPQATSPAFKSNYAGTYSGIIYEKTGASSAQGNTETGKSLFDNVSLNVQSTGAAVLTDASGRTIATGTLQAVESSNYLYNGTGAELTNPCNGLFTFRTNSNSVQQDFYVTFVNNNGTSAAIFSSFWAPSPWSSSTNYNYLYGVGLMK